jgi:Tfp pilus assembly protein PilX
MTHRAVRRLHGEDGASLVLAMAFLILLSLILVALLGFAVTSFKAGGDVGDREKATYAANAAIDTAVARIRQDASMQVGRNASYSPSQACGLTYHPTDGTPDATATCTPQTGSGAVRPGIDSPANAILTRNGDLTVSGAGKLHTTGNVFVNGALSATSGAVIDAHDYAIAATGSCTPNPAVPPSVDAVKTYCNATAANAPQFADGADPGWTPPPLPANAPVDPVPTCGDGSGNRVLTYSPGMYTSTLLLSGTTTSCPTWVPNVFYFKPGVYYFNLSPSNGTQNIWSITGIVVGGTPKGAWYAGSQIPQVPTNGATTSAACDQAAPGVQFVLTGSSQIRLATPATGTAVSSLELCAPPGATPADRVPLYAGMTGPTKSFSYTLRPSRVQGSTQYSNPNNTLSSGPTVSPIDGTLATCTNAGQGPGCGSGNPPSADIHLDEFDWSTLPPGNQIDIPDGLTVNRVRVRVKHWETGTNGDHASIRLTGLSGDQCDTQPLATGTGLIDETLECNVNANWTATKTAGGQEWSGALVATYTSTANAKKDLFSQLDGLEVLADFTDPGSAPTSCITSGTTCPILSNTATDRATSHAGIWGTVYAPLAYIGMDFGGQRHIGFDMGVIVRALNASGLPPTDPTGRFRLGDGTGRSVELVATIPSAAVRVRALVRVVDSATAYGFLAVVREWSTARP